MGGSAGIIAEYNPFHNGHRYQIEELRKRGYEDIIVAMSSTVTQRGDIALFSKYDRARAALKCGADAVIELPYPYSCRSAPDYAYAGMSLLKDAGVDAVSFGSESGEAELLKQISAFIMSEEYSLRLQEMLSHDVSYAEAREKVILEHMSLDRQTLRAANDILAIEYINAATKLSWDVIFEPVRRETVLHDSADTDKNIASASHIRKLITDIDIDSALTFVPDGIKEDYRKLLYSGNYFVKDKPFERAILYSLTGKTEKDFINIGDCSHELAGFIVKQFNLTDDFVSFSASLSSKLFTRSRINRILTSSLIGIPTASLGKKPGYMRILGVKAGKEYLISRISDSSSVPVSHSARRLEEEKDTALLVQMESRACDIQSVFSVFEQPKGRNYTGKLIKA